MLNHNGTGDRPLSRFSTQNGKIQVRRDCIPFISPIDVQLDCDEKTMVQPNVVILFQKEKLKKWGIYGAPDFVLEVILPSTGRKDCIKKLYKYEKAGVREYWLLIDFSGVIQWME